MLTDNIIDPLRVVDYTGAGVTGGIPTRTTCTTLGTGGQLPSFVQSVTAANIQSALDACGANKQVLLNPGTYNLSAGITMTDTDSNTTLAGSGADQTLLVMSGGVSCGGYGAIMCGKSTDLNFKTSPSNTATWSAGYARGTSTITLTGRVGADPVVGNFIILDQVSPTTLSGTDITVSGDNTHNPPLSLEGNGGNAPRPGRDQMQMVKVTSVTGTCNTSCTVGISPSIYASNWNSGNSPGAWWASNPAIGIGFRDFSIDGTSASSSRNFLFVNCYGCFVHGVRSIKADRAHVEALTSARIQVSNSYFHGSQSTGSQGYGFSFFGCSDCKAENNIFQHLPSPYMLNSDSQGSVIDYNFSINDYIGASAFLEATHNFHSAGQMYLLEGNTGSQVYCDNFHGLGGLLTLMRNRFNGFETGKSGANLTPYDFRSCRFVNSVGNVLGDGTHQTGGYQSTNGGTPPIYSLGSSSEYDCTITSISGNGTTTTVTCSSNLPTGFQTSVFVTITGTGNGGWDAHTVQITGTGSNTFTFASAVNASAGAGNVQELVPTDNYVATSILRWGDTSKLTGGVTTTHWCGNSSNTGWATALPSGCSSTSEIPTGLALYASAVPTIGDTGSGQSALPPSFIYVSKPSFFSNTDSFPVHGPDVGGFAGISPANRCYNTISGGTDPDGTGGPYTFNASTCYAASAGGSGGGTTLGSIKNFNVRFF